MHPDEAAEREGEAVTRQFKMPRTRDGHTKVHIADSYATQRRKNRAAATREAFAERPVGINEHLSPSMWTYMHATLEQSRKLRDPSCD